MYESWFYKISIFAKMYPCNYRKCQSQINFVILYMYLYTVLVHRSTQLKPNIFWSSYDNKWRYRKGMVNWCHASAATAVEPYLCKTPISHCVKIDKNPTSETISHHCVNKAFTYQVSSMCWVTRCCMI